MLKSFIVASIATLSISVGSVQAATAKFSPDDAADCAATFGWVLQYMAPNGMPQDQVTHTNLAFMMWGYELNAAMPDANQDAMKEVSSAAVKRLEASLPKADNEKDVDTLINMMIDKGNKCGTKLTAAYNNKPHPVMIELEKQQNAARAADQKAREPGKRLRE